MRPLIFTLVLILSACSSGNKRTTDSGAEPAWVHQATRTVDNGYLVYVGQGQDTTLERATFKAESMAIADLANECSFVPKGARIEDRFTNAVVNVQYAYAKIGVTFEECETAKKAASPDEIKPLANVAMADQLKRYQDMYYTTAPEGETAAAGNTLPQRPAGSGGTVVVQSWPGYYVARQQIFYEKQAIILAPAGAPLPPPAALPGNIAAVQRYEAANPTVRSSPRSWTTVQSHPEFQAPAGMSRPTPAIAGSPMRTYTRPESTPEHGPRRRRVGGRRRQG